MDPWSTALLMDSDLMGWASVMDLWSTALLMDLDLMGCQWASVMVPWFTALLMDSHLLRYAPAQDALGRDCEYIFYSYVWGSL